MGGYLYLGNLTAIPEGFNPTVGGSLYLGNLTAIPEGWIKSNYEYQNVPKIELILKWKRNNKEYIFCDDRFSEVVSVKGNIYRLKDVNKFKEYFLVSDGKGKFAHGDTIKEAKEDLIYKISNRDKSQYSNIDVNEKLSFENCIEMYRVITGACATGTRNFIESKGIKKQKLSVIKIAEITKGNYGSSEFAAFFKITQ